jgi:hypothetical protein
VDSDYQEMRLIRAVLFELWSLMFPWDLDLGVWDF